MSRWVVSGACSLALLVGPWACGGESSTDGTGGGSGGSAGGSGSSTSGGASGGGAGGTAATGGAPAGGTGGCSGDPTDCLVCGTWVERVCENGGWTCPDLGPCLDAGDCPSGQVVTIDGCLSCADASQKLYDGIEAARKAHASCGSVADCVLTGASTTCAGACQVAVSKGGEGGFQAALTKLSADYCSEFVPECGYSTPKCAVPTLVCNAGTCGTQFN